MLRSVLLIFMTWHGLVLGRKCLDLRNPRNRQPGRIHLLWIVRHEKELTWLAHLANRTILQLRNANRPDRLQIGNIIYVTNTQNEHKSDSNKPRNPITHMVVVNEKGLSHVLSRDRDGERVILLTPKLNRTANEVKAVGDEDNNFNIAKLHPLIGCRVRRRRPFWDRVFGYGVHLYPEDHLSLYCCGPKKLVKILRNKCKNASKTSKTKFTFVHEGFS